jgi:DNA-binding transcriptional regulator YiaG
MNKTEYRSAIASLGLSQAGAARFLGVNERTSRRWAIDGDPPPEAVAMLLRLMVAVKWKPERVKGLGK